MLAAQSFRIVDSSADAQGKVTVRHEFDTNSYYLLYRAVRVTDPFTNIVDLASGTIGQGSLMDRGNLATNPAVFYLVRRVPIGQMLDSDGDGIGDAYELAHPAFLNPLDPTDAARDFDGDGLSNLVEYQRGTDPANPDTTPPLILLSRPATAVSIP